ncbi:MAG: TetR/AcrR family transcriptional regulator [Acidobacteria bacterium]|nr:TetR/AcrR family transcriptional regulator [Acidobacteriota bacterium]
MKAIRKRTRGTRDPELTRQALIGAATVRFAERGYDGASLDDIARAARVNKAMISYHFGGKLGLYRAILEATFAPAAERMAELREAPGPAAERLRDYVATFALLAAGRPEFPAMLLREVLSGGRRLDDRFVRHITVIFRTVQDIVEQGVREGAFRRVDPLLTHLSVVGALCFFFASGPMRERVLRQARIPAPRPDAETFVRNLQDIIARGLSAAPAQGS